MMARLNIRTGNRSNDRQAANLEWFSTRPWLFKPSTKDVLNYSTQPPPPTNQGNSRSETQALCPATPPPIIKSKADRKTPSLTPVQGQRSEFCEARLSARGFWLIIRGPDWGPNKNISKIIRILYHRSRWRDDRLTRSAPARSANNKV